MKRGKLKQNLFKIVLSGVLTIVPLFPYSVFADTYITLNNIVGCHISDQRPVDSNFYNQITCNLDANYEGYAQFTFSYRVGSQTTNTTSNRYVSVSGKQFVVEITTSNASMNTATPIVITAISSNNIILSEKQDNEKYSTFPVESFNVQSYAYSNLQYEGFVDDSIYTYGIFSVPQNTEIYRSYGVADREYWFIFIMDKNMYNQSVVSNFLTFNNCTLDSYNFYTRFYYQGNLTYIFRMGIIVNTTNQFSISYIGNGNAVYMPIYCNEKSYLYNSTDFALTYGLSNQLINDLHVIAQGTQSSQSSASDTDQANDDLVTSSDSLFQFESSQNQNMNNALNQIDTNYDVGNKFGSKFLASADWVRTQFNVLTGNTPFGSVLSFSLLLGLALLIIGKVNK